MTIRSQTKVVHHVKDGPKEMYTVDANSAVARFPDEWSHTPWRRNGEKAVPIVEIPADWQDQRPLQRIALAVALGNERKGMTAAKADEIIEAEVERRADEPADEPEPEQRPRTRPAAVKSESESD